MTFDAEIIPLTPNAGAPVNWYVEPFTKRAACHTPGQCSDDCGCNCTYNTMTQIDQLPLIDDIARIFPDEWLAFIIPSAEDDDLYPAHGKLIAHSPNPDEVYDAVNTVLWNQCVYVFFNGNFEALKTSYGPAWQTRPEAAPRPPTTIAAATPKPPEKLLDLIYSAVDLLYTQPSNLTEIIRRLRLARVRAAVAPQPGLLPALDAALDQLESPQPRLNDAAWSLEETLAELAGESI